MSSDVRVRTVEGIVGPPFVAEVGTLLIELFVIVVPVLSDDPQMAVGVSGRPPPAAESFKVGGFGHGVCSRWAPARRTARGVPLGYRSPVMLTGSLVPGLVVTALLGW